jgi:DNA-binding transcriptional ArsR family regulator
MFRFLYISPAPMATFRRSDNHALLTALKHPTRRGILREMADERPTSPSELAARMDESLTNLSYHVRVLADNGALRPVGKRRVRGATQHFYRRSLDAEWARSLLEESER